MKKALILLFMCFFICPVARAVDVDRTYTHLKGPDNSYHIPLSDIKQRMFGDKSVSFPLFTLKSIKQIDFENNTAFTSEELTSLVDSKIGSKFTKRNVHYIQKIIKNYYQNRGYLGADVEVLKEEQGVLKVKINEGKSDSKKIESLDSLL